MSAKELGQRALASAGEGKGTRPRGTRQRRERAPSIPGSHARPVGTLGAVAPPKGPGNAQAPGVPPPEPPTSTLPHTHALPHSSWKDLRGLGADTDPGTLVGASQHGSPSPASPGLLRTLRTDSEAPGLRTGARRAAAATTTLLNTHTLEHTTRRLRGSTGGLRAPRPPNVNAALRGDGRVHPRAPAGSGGSRGSPGAAGRASRPRSRGWRRRGPGSAGEFAGPATSPECRAPKSWETKCTHPPAESARGSPLGFPPGKTGVGDRCARFSLLSGARRRPQRGVRPPRW